MESLCPNCQKLITVPEQYAGQQMKCPLCQQTFQAPSLAGSAAAAPFTPPAPPAEVYKFTTEPSPPMAPAAAAAPSRTFEPSKPKPGDTTPPPPPPPPPAGYTRKFSIQLGPQVLAWIPAVSFFLIFVLSFFAWVGLYPGGVDVYSQNAWQAAFGSPSNPDPVFETQIFEDLVNRKFDSKKDTPSMAVLTLFYLLAFLPIFVMVIAVTAATQLKVKLPPVVEPIWAWRYLAIAGLTLIPVFFLMLQSLVGYPLEDKAKSFVNDRYKADRDSAKTEDAKKKVDILEGMGDGSLCPRRTLARSLVVLFHLLAPICAALAYWVERRGTSRPLPRMELLW
jgi:hypothetical protein